MNLSSVFKIVGLLPTIISTIESIKQRDKDNGRVPMSGTDAREEVRAAVLNSTGTMEALGQLTVTNRKKFNKELDKTIDGIVGMMNHAEWKRGK